MKNLQHNNPTIGAQGYNLVDKASDDVYIYGEKPHIKALYTWYADFEDEDYYHNKIPVNVAFDLGDSYNGLFICNNIVGSGNRVQYRELIQNTDRWDIGNLYSYQFQNEGPSPLLYDEWTLLNFEVSVISEENRMRPMLGYYKSSTLEESLKSEGILQKWIKDGRGYSLTLTIQSEDGSISQTISSGSDPLRSIMYVKESSIDLMFCIM